MFGIVFPAGLFHKIGYKEALGGKNSSVVKYILEVLA